VIASKYRLHRLIGEGGMGEVWLAQNTTLHVDVAIKLIRTEIAGSEEAAQRLLNEARAAAQIGHPAIVRIHDFGSTESDDPFIVMELLQGYSFEELIEREAPIEPTKVVAIILPILAALAAAHPKHIVHRDLKPDNIFICEDEQGGLTPKLVDFGIAKVKYRTIEVDEIPVHLEVPEVRKRLATRLTRMGELLGSPRYMSPEQARGDHEIDGRADLWGIGVVLYYALAGRLPFSGDEDEDILIAILANEPAPIEHVDDELWSIVHKALAKDRERRWSDARAMGEALAGWLASQGVEEDITGRSLKAWLGSSPPRLSTAASRTAVTKRSLAPATLARRRRRVFPLAIGALVVLGVIGGGIALLTQRPAPPETLRGDEVEAPRGEAAPPRVVPHPSLEPRERGEAAPVASTIAAPKSPPKVRHVPKPTASAAPSAPPPSRPASPPPEKTSAPTRKKDGSLPIPDDVPF
jgi:serine/threonine-protein kinase